MSADLLGSHLFCPSFRVLRSPLCFLSSYPYSIYSTVHYCIIFFSNYQNPSPLSPSSNNSRYRTGNHPFPNPLNSQPDLLSTALPVSHTPCACHVAINSSALRRLASNSATEHSEAATSPAFPQPARIERSVSLSLLSFIRSTEAPSPRSWDRRSKAQPIHLNRTVPVPLCTLVSYLWIFCSFCVCAHTIHFE